ncbi:acyl-CoA dehydrogenase C-terminal domain-containing protein, partial [Rhizobium johnstonii]
IVDLEQATAWLIKTLADDKSAEALSCATPYHRLFGLVLTGCYLAKGGLVESADGAAENRIALCRFAAENLLAAPLTKRSR